MNPKQHIITIIYHNITITIIIITTTTRKEKDIQTKS